MRTISAAMTKVLASGSYARYLKVEIDRTGAGAWVDMTALEGRNWVLTANWSDSVDDDVAQATVTLQRAQSYLSLAPLMANSKLNLAGVLVTVFQKIRISVALMPHATLPASTDYMVVFSGRTYSVEWADDAIQVQARDLSGDLMDTFIETNSITYGSSAGVLAETVMQTILTNQAALLPAAVTLYSITGTGGTPFQGADSPGWAILTYRQDMMPILTALKAISTQIGWLLKYRYNASVGNFVLTWYDPLRSNTTSVRTFTASQYYKLSACNLHSGNVRNVIRNFYYDASQVQQQSTTAIDVASIAKYGRKYFQIAEEATSQIRDATASQRMSDRCLADLKDPLIDHTVEMPLFPFVELTDVYTFAANAVHYDSDEKLAVVSCSHTFSATESSTTIALRGAPTGGVQTWHDREVSQIRKQIGTANIIADASGSLFPNGDFSQFSRG